MLCVFDNLRFVVMWVLCSWFDEDIRSLVTETSFRSSTRHGDRFSMDEAESMRHVLEIFKFVSSFGVIHLDAVRISFTSSLLMILNNLYVE